MKARVEHEGNFVVRTYVLFPSMDVCISRAHLPGWFSATEKDRSTEIVWQKKKSDFYLFPAGMLRGNNSKTSGAKDRDKTRFRHTGIEKENVRGKPDRIRNLFRSIKRHCIRGAGSDIGTKPRLTILRPLQNDVRPLSSSRARSFINYISLPPPPPIIN